MRVRAARDEARRKRRPGTLRGAALALAAAALAGALAAPAEAQRGRINPNDPADPEPKVFEKRDAPNKRDPLTFAADEVTYDSITDVVTATGKVELSQNDRIVRADRIVYDRKQDVVRAEGSVVLIEPTGEVVFATTMDITGDLKDAVSENVRMLLANDARLAANGGRRTGGVRTEFAKAVYTACEPCKDDPLRAPLWQVKARKVVHDKEEKEIYFYDATLELFGIPVGYTPYFQHPDPSVKRKTGFLPPVYEHSSYLGYGFTVPYFVVIDDSSDATIYARYASRRGPVLGGEYRQRWDHAALRLRGSATTDIFSSGGGSSDKLRFHLFGDFKQDLNDVWRFGADVQRTSDKQYLREYDYGRPNFLTSRLFAEGFWRRSYAAAIAYSFQELRPEVSKRDTPYAVPTFVYDWVGENRPEGGRFLFNANTRTVLRERGAESTRATAKFGYEVSNYTTAGGHVFDLLATVRGDLFDIDEATDPSNAARTYTGFKGRFFPQIAATWRYPMARRLDGKSYILFEPIVGVVAGPNLKRQWRYANEDALDYVYDDTNFFFPNRTSGDDLLDDGQRINYGVRVGWIESGGASVIGFLGHSLSAKGNNDVSAGSGLRNRASDIIGSLVVNPWAWWDVVARVRVDKNTFKFRQIDALTSIGPKEFRPFLHYILANDDLQPAFSFGDREEIRLGFSSQPAPNWRIAGWASRDQINSQFTGMTLDVQYEDECFLAGIRASRSLSIGGVQSADSRVVVRFVLKSITDTGF